MFHVCTQRPSLVLLLVIRSALVDNTHDVASLSNVPRVYFPYDISVCCEADRSQEIVLIAVEAMTSIPDVLVTQD